MSQLSVFELLGEICHMYTKRPATHVLENEKEDSAQKLPEELTEKILARMPFPSIFKARLLSKSWLSKLSSQGPNDDEVTKHLRIRFQELVSESSNNWKTFFAWVARDNLWVYNLVSHRWQRPLSLSFLPTARTRNWRVQTEGALMFLLADMGRMYVANVLTRNWRILPSCQPDEMEKFYILKMVTDPKFQTYKVILVGENVRERGCVAKIYDSKSDEWSRKEIMNLPDGFRDPPWNPFEEEKTPAVYLNGLLYAVATWDCLLAFNIDYGTWEEVPLAFVGPEFDYPSVDLVACNGSLFEIMTEGGSFRVLKVDLERRKLVEVAQGPPAPLSLGSWWFNTQPIGHGDFMNGHFFSNQETRPIGHGDFIFLAVEEVGGRVLAYNVEEDRWGCLISGVSQPSQTGCENEKTISAGQDLNSSWYGDGNAVSFQPGLNPFVQV